MEQPMSGPLPDRDDKPRPADADPECHRPRPNTPSRDTDGAIHGGQSFGLDLSGDLQGFDKLLADYLREASPEELCDRGLGNLIDEYSIAGAGSSEANAPPEIVAPEGSCEHKVLIPEHLHSVYEGGPFNRCCACRKPLLEADLYEIQKSYSGTEVVFETAICHECGSRLAAEISADSLQAMKGFLLCCYKPSVDLHHCHFCQDPRQFYENYSVVGLCREANLLMACIVLCEKCGDSLTSRLSSRTQEIQDDFIRNNFPGIPADFDLSPHFGGLL